MGRILKQRAHGIERRCRGDDGTRELKSLQSGGGGENFRIARSRSQCGRSWGWSPGLAAVGCLALFMVGSVCEATYMLERHRSDRACSLRTNDRTQLNPVRKSQPQKTGATPNPLWNASCCLQAERNPGDGGCTQQPAGDAFSPCFPIIFPDQPCIRRMNSAQLCPWEGMICQQTREGLELELAARPRGWTKTGDCC